MRLWQWLTIYRAITRKILLPVPQIPIGASNPTTLKIGYVGIITFPLPGVKRGKGQ